MCSAPSRLAAMTPHSPTAPSPTTATVLPALTRESEPTFEELKKWRAGVEALISLMKRVFGWDRCLFEGTPGAEAWMDWSVLAYNLRLYGRKVPRPC